MSSNVVRGWSHSWVGRTSVVGTGLLALGGFTLSFAALRNLAVRVGMPERLGWIRPLLIDGMIIEATLAVVALSQRGSRQAVWYAWFLLGVGALVSVGSNGAHAVLMGHGWAGAAASSVPPVVLLATTHLTVLLMAAPESPALAPPATVIAETHPHTGLVHASALLGGHAPESPSIEPIRAEAPEVVSEPAVEDATPAAEAHELGHEEPEGVTAFEEEAEAVEPLVTEEGLERWVAQQEENGVRVTGAMVAGVLGVSASTGRRRLAALHKARQPRLRLAGAE